MNKTIPILFLAFFLLLSSIFAFMASLWFYDSFMSFGATAAFIPFLLWNINFTKSGEVLNIVYYVQIGSLFLASFSSLALGITIGRISK